MNFSPAQQNCIDITNRTIKLLGVKANLQTLKDKLSEHPDFPSILAINDCLQDLHINTCIYRFDTTAKQTLPESPFLAFTSQNGGTFMLIQHLSEDQLLTTEDSGVQQTLSLDELNQSWNGIALVPSKTALSAEPNYWSNRIRHFFDRYQLAAAGLVFTLIVVMALANRPNDYNYLPTLILSTLGVITCIPILSHAINQYSPLLQKTCGNNTNAGCHSVLNSPGAKLTPWLSWGEVGFFYFSGQTLLLLADPKSVLILTQVAPLAIGYTIYSLSYQFLNKQWCLLCCLIQLILVTQMIILLPYHLLNGHNLSFESGTMVTILICYLIPIMSWSMLKPLLKQNIKTKGLQKQLTNLKFDPQVFSMKLHQVNPIELGPELEPLSLGNLNSQKVITIISNPFCQSCSQAHAYTEQWLDRDPTIKINIIFSTSAVYQDPKTKVASRFIELNRQNDPQTLKKALSSWYHSAGKHYEQFVKGLPETSDEATQTLIQLQHQWCRYAKITSTPTIFYKGRQLPETYQLEDLKYLI